MIKFARACAILAGLMALSVNLHVKAEDVQVPASPLRITPAAPQAAPAPASPQLHLVPQESAPAPAVQIPDTPAAPAPSVPSPVATPLPAAPASPPAPANAPQPLKSIKAEINNGTVKPEKIDLPPPEFNKTSMFRKEDYDKFMLVYNAYKDRMKNHTEVEKTPESSKVDEILGKLKLTAEKLPSMPPAIYLNSILYSSDKSTSAWVNGKKMQAGDSIEGIRLVNLTPTTATLELAAGIYDGNFKNWLDNFSADEEKTPMGQNQPPKRRGIKVLDGSKTISFVLHPNQHLDTGMMEIHEGKPPVIEAKKDDAGKAADPMHDPLKKLIQPAPITPPSKVVPIDANEPKKPLTEAGPDKKAEFKISEDGHYYVPAQINNSPLTFKVDTGATVSAMSAEDARKAGVDVDKLDYKFDVRLADGTTIKAAQATIKNINIGQIKLENIDMLVTQGKMDKPLIGMSLLSKLKKFSIENGSLTMYQ